MLVCWFPLQSVFVSAQVSWSPWHLLFAALGCALWAMKPFYPKASCKRVKRQPECDRYEMRGSFSLHKFERLQVFARLGQGMTGSHG